MKKSVTAFLAGILIVSTLAGCGKSEDGEGSKKAESFDTGKEITVISREEGSGTRSAFIELFGIETKDASGNKIDNTTSTADINDSTGIMLTNVAENKYAIGYVSLGALNNTVKAVKIDGAQATVANIKDGTYKISRPFNIVTKNGLSAAAKDFIAYILSTEGQKIVQDNGYIPLSETKAYSATKATGKIVVAGSSSVTPVMEKLKEAYLKINTGATIEVQQSDSTTGINSAVEGICDIGMASRDLKDSEKTAGVTATQIATDGLAVIVNKKNTVDNLTADQVKAIYVGETTVWSEVAE